jgi:hypothetical protein
LTGSAATQPGISVTGAAPSASSGTAGPHAKAKHWLAGLNTLQRRMNAALLPGTITPSSLRQTATVLRRCAPELAALGPAPGLLQPVYGLARRACSALEQGATYAVAAGRAYTTTSPSQKLTKLLNQLDAAVNRGTNLLARAYYGAPISPGS